MSDATSRNRPLQAVEAALNAYVAKDRQAIEALIADDYRFTSPLDNSIDRATYFDRCWPNSEGMTGMEIVSAAEDGEWAWVMYEAWTRQKRFRNVEVHRVRNGHLVETQVYFGWDLPHPAPTGGFVTGQP